MDWQQSSAEPEAQRRRAGATRGSAVLGDLRVPGAVTSALRLPAACLEWAL